MIWQRNHEVGVAFVAPLRGLADPNLTPEPAKAPWYFAGLQELLSHFDPLVAGILIPTGAVITLLLLPYIDRNPSTVARHRKVAIVIFSAYMLFDVQRVVNGGETNYITATLAIYLDLYNVFVNLLSILGIFGGNRN